MMFPLPTLSLLSDEKLSLLSDEELSLLSDDELSLSPELLDPAIGSRVLSGGRGCSTDERGAAATAGGASGTLGIPALVPAMMSCDPLRGPTAVSPVTRSPRANTMAPSGAMTTSRAMTVPMPGSGIDWLTSTGKIGTLSMTRPSMATSPLVLGCPSGLPAE